jgi:hypothetical protein
MRAISCSAALRAAEQEMEPTGRVPNIRWGRRPLGSSPRPLGAVPAMIVAVG